MTEDELAEMARVREQVLQCFPPQPMPASVRAAIERMLVDPWYGGREINYLNSLLVDSCYELRFEGPEHLLQGMTGFGAGIVTYFLPAYMLALLAEDDSGISEFMRNLIEEIVPPSPRLQRPRIGLDLTKLSKRQSQCVGDFLQCWASLVSESFPRQSRRIARVLNELSYRGLWVPSDTAPGSF